MWEGVLYYLTPEAVDSTLAFVRARSPRGSRLVFDYQTTAARSERRVDPPLRAAMRAAAPAEPIRFRIEEGQVEPFLSTRGYRLAEHLSSREMERRYLTLRDGSLAGEVAGYMALASAETL